MSDQQLLDAIDEVTRRPGPWAPAAPTASDESAQHTRMAIETLAAAGWIEDRGNGHFTLSRTRGLVIGLDLGGTKLRGAIGDAAGTISDEYDLPTSNNAPDSALAQIAEMAESLAARAGVPLSAIEQISVGVPGAVAPDGRVTVSPNVAFHQNTPLADTLIKKLGVPVSVDNDGNLSAYGEYMHGIGKERGARSLAFLALGTGVGMGLIVEGQMLRGASGAAGEIGLLPFGPDPFAAAAAEPDGAFEAAVGSEAIRRGYAARHPGTEFDARDVFERANAGDADAQAVIAEATRGIAVGVASVIALLDPGIVVIGGGIGARPGFAEAVARLTAQLFPTACDIVPSRLGERAGVVGALAQALNLSRRRLISRHETGTLRGAA
ncbi:ROK family protein [Devosia sp.]|uniref:ROK family protein n=1 Tax=Devosia sp. TaxID=1871048 RepID=UPI003BA91B57